MNYFFLYKSDGTIYESPYKGSAEQWTNIPSACAGVLGPIDESDPTAQDAHACPDRYLVQDGELVAQPYFSMSAVESTTTAGQWTVTATLNKPPNTPPTSCTFTVLGQTYTQAVTNYEATLQLTLHPAIANQKIDVTVSADGCVDGVIDVGGSDTSIPMKIVATTTPNTVSPVYRMDGEAYYANLIPTETLLANIGTALSHVTDTLYNIIVPLLQNAAYTPLSLTADQKSAVADIQALTFFTTLANAYPAGKPRQLQHASYVANNQTSNNYYQDYVNDLTSLGWT